jgi:hypothetical protein
MSSLLLSLNDADSACDSLDGWRFLLEEAKKLVNSENSEVDLMRTCLEFFLVVEEGLAGGTEPLRTKARELEVAFDA